MNEREIDEIDNEEYRLNEIYTGPSETTEMYTVPVENNYCKSKNGWIIFLLFTTLLFGGLFIYYFFVRTKCKENKDIQSEKEIKTLKNEKNKVELRLKEMTELYNQAKTIRTKFSDYFINPEDQESKNELIQYINNLYQETIN